jgi:hypothetical protein
MHIRCTNCGAELQVEQQRRTAVCPYCASPSVVERPARDDAPNPTFALGFSQTEAAAKSRVGHWLKTRSRFCHSGVRNASLEDVRGVYVPAYLYSAVARASYSARIGEEYTRTESYSTTDSNGRRVTRTRTVVETEWRPLQGEYATYLADVVVTASRGLPNAELEAIEPFDLGAMRRYTPAIVSGWIAEEPSLTSAECFAQAHDEAVNQLRTRLARFMPGDKHAELQLHPRLEEESVDLVLLPVWVLAARYDPAQPPFRVVMNGQTGEIHGKAPLSSIKIVVAALLAVALLVAGYALLQHLALGGGR